MGGQKENEGRVEICYGSSWGTLSEPFVYASEANVICRQLGFSDQGKTKPAHIVHDLSCIYFR